MGRFGNIPRKDELLGLTGEALSRERETIRVGDNIMIKGQVLRIHKSGFLMIGVSGNVHQPAVLINSQNATLDKQ